MAILAPGVIFATDDNVAPTSSGSPANGCMDYLTTQATRGAPTLAVEILFPRR